MCRQLAGRGVYEPGACGRRVAGMAEKRRGSPCSMLSLRAHAFSVEALIGAEKQQQLQKKRRRLVAGEAGTAPESDGGCSRSGVGAGEKRSSEGDRVSALPTPPGATSRPTRSGANSDPACTSGETSGESAYFA